MSAAVLSVRWKDHTSEFVSIYKSLLQNNFLVDCTISAEGQSLKAHRLILSACSPYFHTLFGEETGNHPFIILLNASFEALKAVIDFVYRGETQIPEGILKEFLSLAQSLEIKGLNSFSKHSKNENQFSNTTENVPQGPSGDSQVLSEIQSVCGSKDNQDNKDHPEYDTQQHSLCSEGYSDAVHRNSTFSFEGNSARCEDERSASVIVPLQKQQRLLESEKVPLDTDITVKPEPFYAVFLSETRNEILDNVNSDSNVPVSGNFTSEVEVRTVSTYGEQDLSQLSSFSESLRENVESSVLPPSQQQHMQFSDEVSSGQDIAEKEPLLPEILVPKSEPTNEENEVPMDDPCVAGNNINETDERTEPTHEQHPGQCSSADGLLPEVDHPSGEGRNADQRQVSSEGGKRPLRCDVCGASFTFPSHLAIHRRMHTGERPFRCEVCGDAFMRSYDLVTHMRRHTGERPYVCDVCGIAFSQSGTLATHKRTHTGARPFRCEICGDSFMRSYDLVTHVRRHAGKGPYPCNVCGKTFAAKQHLYSHRRVHTRSARKYHCSLCGKEFSHKNNLINHERTHTGERPYRCDVCGKAFTQPQTLNNHKTTHTGERAYSCDVCGKTFTHKRTLATHWRLTNHKATQESERPHRCDACGEVFPSASSLVKHKRCHAEGQQ